MQARPLPFSPAAVQNLAAAFNAVGGTQNADAVTDKPMGTAAQPAPAQGLPQAPTVNVHTRSGVTPFSYSGAGGTAVQGPTRAMTPDERDAAPYWHESDKYLQSQGQVPGGIPGQGQLPSSPASANT